MENNLNGSDNQIVRMQTKLGKLEVNIRNCMTNSMMTIIGGYAGVMGHIAFTGETKSPITLGIVVAVTGLSFYNVGKYAAYNEEKEELESELEKIEEEKKLTYTFCD